MKYKVNKEKCIGCQVCLQTCPGAVKIGEDGKAETIDQEKLKKCGGESVCPLGAIEKVSESPPGPPPYGPPPSGGRGLGRGRGPGWSRGMGRKWRGGRG